MFQQSLKQHILPLAGSGNVRWQSRRASIEKCGFTSVMLCRCDLLRTFI